MNTSWQTELIAALASAPEHVNPAIGLALVAQRAELAGDTDFLSCTARSGAIERAISEGRREGEAVARTLNVLGKATPAASKSVPVGF